MKRLIASIGFLIPILSLGAGPVFGGNLPAIRPGHVTDDSAEFDLALSYLQPGDVARVQTVAWEVLWEPTGAYDFRGIDASIERAKKKGVKTIWLLQPTPHPSSPWYAAGWSDWFMPKRGIWPGVVRLNTAIATHIISQSKRVGAPAPLLQLWNEPQGGKPGGSSKVKKGEWAPELHELLFKLVTDLKENGVPREQIVGPAISAFGEGKDSEAAEFSTMMPSGEFDWLSECGYRAYHIRMSSGASNGNVDRVKAGIKATLAGVARVDKGFAWPKDQKVAVTEFYVTPGDVGVPVGTDMIKYHALVFDLLKESAFSFVTAWGLRPDEKDKATDPWSHFGGLGDSLVKWRGGISGR